MRRIAVVAAMVGVLVAPIAAPVHALASHPQFSIMASAEGTKVKFLYLFDLPAPEAGWVAGHRVGYGCAYMFLRVGEELIGRVTFTRIEYTKINDKYMDEAARYYDGSVYTGSDHQLNDCPPPTEPYVEAEGRIGPLPLMTFSDASTGETLEIRDYRKVEQSGSGPGWKFQIVSARPQRVTVLAYQDREPILAIYYDRLSPSIRLTSNFSTDRGRRSTLSLNRWGSEWFWTSDRS